MHSIKLRFILLFTALVFQSNAVHAAWSTGGPFQLNEPPTQEEGQRNDCSKYVEHIRDLQHKEIKEPLTQGELRFVELVVEAYLKECKLPDHARDIKEEHYK